MERIITGGKIITDGRIIKDRDIVIKDDMVVGLIKHNTWEKCEIDLEGMYIAPSFIDLHCHGANGYQFRDATDEAFFEICNLHSLNGTGVLYPTISTTDPETLDRALKKADELLSSKRNRFPLYVPGIHLEGPYLSEKMCGAQDTMFVRLPKKDEYLSILEKYGRIIKRWSYAPELDDGSFLGALNEYGVKAAIAHSDAEYSDVKYVYENGLRLITHLYSCTSTIRRVGGYRHIGINECAYLFDDMFVEAIGDGSHIPPELMRLIVKMKTADRVCLVTDAIRFAGMKNIENTKGGTGNVPYIIEDGVAKLMDRSAFAGSIATTGDLLKRTYNAGIPLENVVKMLTKTPAAAMGLSAYGSIAPGYKASFTVFNECLEIIKRGDIY